MNIVGLNFNKIVGLNFKKYERVKQHFVFLDPDPKKSRSTDSDSRGKISTKRQTSKDVLISECISKIREKIEVKMFIFFNPFHSL